MTWRRPAAALAVACVMGLSACGGGGAGEDPAASALGRRGWQRGVVQERRREGPVDGPAATRPRAGTFTVLTNQVPATLDPTRAYYTDSTAILSDLVLRSLTQFVYNPDTNDMQLVPDMATDLGRPSEDNKAWTFTLRDGLKYEDGTPVKAEDVAYAVKRSFAIAELPDGPTYNTTFFLDGDKYKGPFKDKGQYKGVEVNGNDITIKMRRPFTDMDYYASFPQFTAIPQAKDNPETYGDKPLATGPYKFADYKPGTRAEAGQERPVGPEHRPGPHPGRRRVGLQVRPGHRQARERHHQRPGLRADHVDLRQREPLVVPLDLVRQGPPGDRHLAVHVHVVHRHDEDQGARGPSGPRLGVPVRGGLEGRR